MTTLAVDCMGGDHGPRVILAACRQFLERHPEARLLLVGAPDALKGFTHERASVVAATEVVAMDDAVEVALRKKKDSSMRVAIQLVKDGRARTVEVRKVNGESITPTSPWAEALRAAGFVDGYRGFSVRA